MQNTAETAVAVTGSVVGSILTPADYHALDELIEKLGAKDARLTDSEKEMALKVIDQWDESVTSRIKENAETAKTVLDFLSGKMTYWSTAADIIEMMTEYVGEIPEYVAFNEAVEEYSQATAELNASNVDIPITPDMTVAEVDNAHMEQQRAQLIASRKEREAYAKVSTAATAYVKALNKDARIQAAKSELASYRRKASRMATTCSDKAARAKINISISNESVRKVLHEMMEFAKTV